MHESLIGSRWRKVLISRDGDLHADISEIVLDQDYKERVLATHRLSAGCVSSLATAASYQGILLREQGVGTYITSYDSSDPRSVDPGELSFFWKAYDIAKSDRSCALGR